MIVQIPADEPEAASALPWESLNPDKVKRFIDRKKIQSKVVILEEENPNAWIEKIDKSWSGALPSTLIINPNNGKRRFVQGELKDGELERLIKEISE